MRSGEEADAEDIHLGNPVQAEVDDADPQVGQSARDDLRAAIAAVKADPGDEGARALRRPAV